jgi:tRNA 2-thiouridine synthesizing protein A
MEDSPEQPSVTVDARGLRCPVNWAKAKAVLETLAPGTLVEVLVDDPRSRRDLPAAAEAEGHAVLEVRDLAAEAGSPGGLRILLEK